MLSPPPANIGLLSSHAIVTVANASTHPMRSGSLLALALLPV